MSRTRKALMLVGSLALLLPITFSWYGGKELRYVRLELRNVTNANDVLKQTLADMIVAISAKDKEIDRLRLSACDGGGKVAGAPIRPAHDRISDPAVVRGGAGRPAASMQETSR